MLFGDDCVFCVSGDQITAFLRHGGDLAPESGGVFFVASGLPVGF